MRRPSQVASTPLAESARAIVARTRADQGLSPRVTDPAVLARLATLIGTATQAHRA